MTNVVMEQLRHLGGTLGELRVRVRAAVAGEVGRAVADAVREVVGAALLAGPAGPGPGPAVRRGRVRPVRRLRPGHLGRRRADRRWAGGRAARDEVEAGPPATDPPPGGDRPGRGPDGRQVVARPGPGPRCGATALGVAVAGAVLAGGPAARAAVAVLWAAHRLLAATDALGDGAKALDRV